MLLANLRFVMTLTLVNAVATAPCRIYTSASSLGSHYLTISFRLHKNARELSTTMMSSALNIILIGAQIMSGIIPSAPLCIMLYAVSHHQQDDCTLDNGEPQHRLVTGLTTST